MPGKITSFLIDVQVVQGGDCFNNDKIIAKKRWGRKHNLTSGAKSPWPDQALVTWCIANNIVKIPALRRNYHPSPTKRVLFRMVFDKKRIVTVPLT